MFIILVVDVSNMAGRFPQSDQIVECNACQHDAAHSFRSLAKSFGEALEALNKDPEGILNYTTSPGQTIVVYPLSVGHLSFGMWLHQPLLQGESVVCNDEVLQVHVIIRQWLGFRKAYGVSEDGFLEFAVVEDLRIPGRAAAPNICPGKLVVSVD